MPTPTPLELAGWLGCLVAVVMGINQVMRLLDRFKETPTPRDTYQVKGDYVTQRELKDVREDVDALAGELRESITEVRREMAHDKEVNQAAAEARAQNIHKRVDEVLAAVSELRGFVSKALRPK
jgi:hypothetical protein